MVAGPVQQIPPESVQHPMPGLGFCSRFRRQSTWIGFGREQRYRSFLNEAASWPREDAMIRHLLLITLSVILGLLGACRSSNIEINVRYDRISGLTAKDRVVFDNNDAGVVTSVTYTREGAYLVRLGIDKAYANALTEHAMFFIVPDTSRAGIKAVEIRHAQPGGRLLGNGVIVDGANESDTISAQLQKEIDAGIALFKKTLDRVGQEIRDFSQSKEYLDMKRSLEALAREMARKEKAAREDLKRNWLPRIQRELDELRERLKQQGREKQLTPLEEQVERLRYI